MFTIKYITAENKHLDYIHIKNTNYSAKLYPSLGASLQELIINNTSIIKGLNSNLLNINEYYQAYFSAILFPFSGRIENGKYTYNQKNYQLKQNEIENKHALHGLVYDQHFKSIDEKTTSNTAQITLEYISDGSLQGFPYKFSLRAKYTFKNDGVILKVSIKNTDTISFPFSLGWHPYFKSEVVNDTVINFNSKIAYSINESMIPQNSYKHNNPSSWKINKTHLDTSYILNKPIIKYKSQVYNLVLEIENTGANFLQLYTPKDRLSIAIEPMTALPNAYNNTIGLKELYPNTQTYCQWSLTINTYA